jgi:hypothetical protein
MHCANSGHPLIFENITNNNKAVLEDLFPGAFCFAEKRDASDYIYLREKLVTLSGKKYHSKRNHIARFKDNSNWSYEPITSNNIDECYEMSMNWHEKYREVEKNGIVLTNPLTDKTEKVNVKLIATLTETDIYDYVGSADLSSTD